MKIRQIIDALEDFAPLALQDGFDNAGLQIGLPQDVDATGVLLCLDVTEAIIDEAVSRGCNMVVSHHPLLFHPLKSISGKDYVERVVIKAIQKGITLYAAHTNLDNAPGGVNHKMAEKLQPPIFGVVAISQSIGELNFLIMPILIGNGRK